MEYSFKKEGVDVKLVYYNMVVYNTIIEIIKILAYFIVLLRKKTHYRLYKRTAFSPGQGNVRQMVEIFRRTEHNVIDIIWINCKSFKYYQMMKAIINDGLL